MRQKSIATRYARAFLMVTEKRGETAQALAHLRGLLATTGPETRARALLASPLVRLSDKRQVAGRALHGRVTPSVALLLDLLLRKKRFGELETIVHEFEALVERREGIRRAQVVSAVPLEPAERDRLHRELERITGGQVRLTADTDPSLIGGAFVRIGDRVLDRTVRTLLEAMEQRLLEATV